MDLLTDMLDEEALPHTREALRLLPPDDVVRSDEIAVQANAMAFFLGVSLHGIGDEAEARTALEKVVRLDKYGVACAARHFF
jgi:hypothetical protein